MFHRGREKDLEINRLISTHRHTHTHTHTHVCTRAHARALWMVETSPRGRRGEEKVRLKWITMWAYRLAGLKNPLDIHGSVWSFVEVLIDATQRSEELHGSWGVCQRGTASGKWATNMYINKEVIIEYKYIIPQYSMWVWRRSETTSCRRSGFSRWSFIF